VILPGLVRIALPPRPHPGAAPLLPKLADGTLDYNMAIPAMLARYYPSGMLGLGLTALMASFMSGMAGNVTAFNTVWTYDIYQGHINPNATDAPYLWVARYTTVGAPAEARGVAHLSVGYGAEPLGRDVGLDRLFRADARDQRHDDRAEAHGSRRARLRPDRAPERQRTRLVCAPRGSRRNRAHDDGA